VWVLGVGFFGVGFFRWVYPKKPGGFFWVRTRVSEPWKESYINGWWAHVFAQVYWLLLMASAWWCPSYQSPLMHHIQSCSCHQLYTALAMHVWSGYLLLALCCQMLSAPDCLLLLFISHLPTVGVLWRNFLNSEFGTKYRYFWRCLISQKHSIA